MTWQIFWAAVGTFFSDVGSVFLSNLKAAIPVLEQEASNILTVIVDAIIAGIESGAIPLPVLAIEGATKLDLGKQKRDIAFDAVQAKLATITLPKGVTVSNSLIYWQIETSYQKYKVTTSGNGGNFPGGNTGPQN